MNKKQQIAKYRLVAILFNHFLGFKVSERIKVYKKFLSDQKGFEIVVGIKHSLELQEHLRSLIEFREIWFRQNDINDPYEHFALFVEDAEEYLGLVTYTAPKCFQKAIKLLLAEESRSPEAVAKAITQFKLKFDGNDSASVDEGDLDYDGNIFDLNEAYEM